MELDRRLVAVCRALVADACSRGVVRKLEPDLVYALWLGPAQEFLP
jgi:hypothetical protein